MIPCLLCASGRLLVVMCICGAHRRILGLYLAVELLEAVAGMALAHFLLASSAAVGARGVPLRQKMCEPIVIR